MTSHEVRRWSGLVPILIFFVLATFDLTRLPLWWDEGGSLDFLDRPLSAIAALDTHPPGYHLVLLAWTSLAGRSPYAARVLSALIGTLAVAVFGWAGRRLTAASSTPTKDEGRTTKVVARSTFVVRPSSFVFSVLLASAPFLLHHAREARMYALAIALTALSLGLLAPLVRSGAPPRRGAWVAYTAALAAGMYVHLGFAAVVVAEALGVAVSLRRWPGRWRAWLGVGIGLAGSLAPWALMLWSTGGVVLSDTRLAAGAQLDLVATALEVARQLAAGTIGSVDVWGWLPLLALGGLAAFGLWSLRREPMVAVVLGGLLALGVLGAARINYGLEGDIAVAARLGFGALPGLLGLAAVGALAIPARWRVVPVVVVVAACVPGLWRALTEPVDPSEDVRPVIAHLQSIAQPGDVVLYTFRWQNGDLGSYWPNHALQPVLRLYGREEVRAYVEALEARSDRVWLLNYHTTWGDPSDPIYPLFEERAAIAERITFGATEVVLIAFVPPLPDPAPSFRQLGGATLSYAPLPAAVHAGDVVGLRLRWIDAPPGFNVFVHLGAPDSAPLAQSDRAVAGRVDGEMAAALLVPPGTPPGRYGIFVGLYDPATGARVPVPAPAGCDTGDRLCLGTVEVLP